MGIDKVFVIIVTYKGQLWYDRCFTSLRNSNIAVQTVVIDNASDDGTVEYIQEHYPEVHLMPSDINLGFGQGNNKGMRYALDNGADYVFLLNQDAWIEPDSIHKLVEIHKNNIQYGILSPMHVNAEKDGIEKGLINYVADKQITDPQWINDLYFQRLGDVYDTQYVNAAAWLLPRKTLETVGGFDPIFYHYGEDDNYMQRVLFHGFKIGICPHITICHDTERREIKQVFLDNTSNTVLLTKYANINENLSTSKFIIYSLRKATLKFLKLNIKLGKELISNAYFMMKMRKQIEDSRIQNKQKTTSWL